MHGKHNLFAGKVFAPLVLPAVYDDVLSYEEWLSKVIYRINELQEYIDDTMENIEQIIDQTVTRKIAPVKEDVDRIKIDITNINTALDQLDKDIKNSIKDCKNYTDNKLGKLEKRYDKEIQDLSELIEKYRRQMQTANKELEQRITDAYQKADLFILKEAKRYTHYVMGVNNNKIFAEIHALQERMDELVKEYPDLYDPATGRNENMQDLIYNMYRALRVLGIGAMLYDDQQITAEEFDAMGLSAQQYDVAFSAHIWDSFKTMFNPFTGKQESTREVLNYLINKLRWNAKTTTEYEDWGFTANEFDNSTYGAYEQDNSKYYTQPEEDTLNKAYKNWRLLASDNEGVDEVVFNLDDINEISVVYGNDGMFTFPMIDGNYTAPNGNTIHVTSTDTTGDITFSGYPNIVYGVTYVKDVSNLDK